MQAADALATVLSHCAVTQARRHRSGAAHYVAKALPQRSIVRAADRASLAFLDDARTVRFLAQALQCLFGSRAPPVHDAVTRYFRAVLVAVRLRCKLALDDCPGLRNAAERLLDVDELCNAAGAAADVARNHDIQACNNVHIAVTPVFAPLSVAVLLQLALPRIGAVTDIREAHATHVLHSLYANGNARPTVADMLQAAGAPEQTVRAFEKLNTLRRRQRKAAVRAIVASLQGNERVRVRIALHALSRCVSLRVRRPQCRLHDIHMARATQPRIFFCAACGSVRNNLNSSAGGSRILFDFDTQCLTCGKRSTRSCVSACEETPLVNEELGAYATLETYQRRVYGACTLCAGIFEVVQGLAWRKGVFACKQCYHRVACLLDARNDCDKCRLVLPTLRAADNGTFVLERACDDCVAARAAPQRATPSSATSAERRTPAACG